MVHILSRVNPNQDTKWVFVCGRDDTPRFMFDIINAAKIIKERQNDREYTILQIYQVQAVFSLQMVYLLVNCMAYLN